MAMQMGESVRNCLQSIVSSNNYSMHILKLNALQFGMPQQRPRSFVSFWLDMGVPLLSRLETKSLLFRNVASYLSGNIRDIGKPIGQHNLKASAIWAWIKSYPPDKYDNGKTGVIDRVLLGKPFACVVDYAFLVPERIISLQKFLQEANQEDYACLLMESKVVNKLLDKGKKDPFSMRSCAWDDVTPCCLGTASPAVTHKTLYHLVHPLADTDPELERYLHTNKVKFLAMGVSEAFTIADKRASVEHITQSSPIPMICGFLGLVSDKLTSFHYLCQKAKTGKVLVASYNNMDASKRSAENNLHSAALLLLKDNKNAASSTILVIDSAEPPPAKDNDKKAASLAMLAMDYAEPPPAKDNDDKKAASLTMLAMNYAEPLPAKDNDDAAAEVLLDVPPMPADKERGQVQRMLILPPETAACYHHSAIPTDLAAETFRFLVETVPWVREQNGFRLENCSTFMVTFNRNIHYN